MSSKTKIVVLHLKELIYTGIFAILGILFIILLFIMFRSDKETPEEQPKTPETETEDGTQTPIYQPGAYRSALYLEDETVEINLTVDETQIVSLTMTPVSDKISTLYPLPPILPNCCWKSSGILWQKYRHRDKISCAANPDHHNLHGGIAGNTILLNIP